MTIAEFFGYSSVILVALGITFFAIYPMIALRDKKPKA